MTKNQDHPYRVGRTFVDSDEVQLRLCRKTLTPEVYLTVTDYAAAVGVSFSLNRPTLDQLITSLQHESELLAAPTVGERRQAPASHPYLAGCAAIRVEDVAFDIPQTRRWCVYRGSAAGTWVTDAEVADWIVIE